jgi:tetratricopeptide (TPR) repeat protein
VIACPQRCHFAKPSTTLSGWLRYQCAGQVRWILCIFLALIPPAFAQEIEQIELPLIQQQPSDLIVLTEDEGGQSVKIAPLTFRRMPSSPNPNSKLEVVLVKYPDRRYEIRWKAIEKILFYEQRIYDEAVQQMRAKDFVTAFQNLSFLFKNYPDMPDLEGLRRKFIYESAIDRFGKGELRQTLSALEELKMTAPGFESARVTTALSRVAHALIGQYQSSGDLGSAQKLLNRMRERYGPTLPAVADWDKRLETMALQRKDVADRYMEQGEYVKARRAAVEMLSIFPDLDEAKELLATINSTYPMVRVGVMQRSDRFDSSSLVDWPARRSGGLVQKSLFQFLETGSEGGRYGFALGTYRLSDDRQELLLSLDPSVQTSVTAFELAQELVARADPDSTLYDPSWAAIFNSVTTRSASQVLVSFRGPNVLPYALMQWPLPNKLGQPGALPGDYYTSETEENETSFKLFESKQNGQPVEVVEVFYDDPKKAVNDLLRGEIDVLDQLYPADARRLAVDSRITIGSYALPSSHMLIPVSDHEYLQRTKFRRALLYAVNRQAMLTGELLNSNSYDDGRLLSGPFPLGNGESDPLAYAYNPEVQPTPYSPQLARLLLVMATQELNQIAEKKGTPPPKLETLIVGCPDFEFARVAVQAMIQQWQNVGVKAEIRVLPTAELLAKNDCDLIYTIATMWEPATDIERLLGGRGAATTDDPFIIQALNRLRDCRNWREVRIAMQDLHQLIDFHLPVLPLWQVNDRFAVSKRVEGLEDRPVSLYQDIARWRINVGTTLAGDGR